MLLAYHPKIALTIAAIVLIGLDRYPVMASWARAVWIAAVSIFAAFTCALIAAITAVSLRSPPLYDFGCFWFFGRAARFSHDPYNGAALVALASGTPGVDKTFIAETLQAGMPYAPPSVLLFYPLAFFHTLNAAAVAWWTFLLITLAMVIVVLWRRWFRVPAGLLACAVLVTCFGPTLTALRIGQTSLLMLLAAVLYVSDTSMPRRGVWIAIGAIVKPPVLFLALYSACKREYRVLVAMVSALAVASLAAIGLTSFQSFLSYFVANPVERVPGSLYREVAYQSLFSVWMRLSHDSSAHYQLAGHYLYIASAIALVAISVWVCLRLPSGERDVAIALLVPLALIVYPFTLYFYGILLIIPMLVVWKIRAELPGQQFSAAAFWLIEYLLLSDPMKREFLGFVLCWVVMLAIALSRAAPLRAQSPRAQPETSLSSPA